ncbi:MAG: hypothetical protein JNM10_19685 [Planctomycetia bacterium]|nr:hypothetical protein [Planctomycetia bacterium]
MHVRRTFLLVLATAIGATAVARADDPTPPTPATPVSPEPPPVPSEPPAPTVEHTTPPPAPAVPAAPAAPAAPMPVPAPRASDRWIGCLPPQRTWVPREEVTPPTTCERSVPVYETVRVPIHEERRVPVYREEQVPVYGTREVDAYEDRSVPEYGEVPVTTYETRAVPVKLALPNPFSCDCEDLELKLWDRCERVACGTRYERGIVGWRTERVVVGKRTETYQTGTEPKQVVAGWRTEVVEVGSREEQRCVGWRTETVIVEPERRRVVHDCVDVPSRLVTVTTGDPAKTEPLPGTTAVVHESVFSRALANEGR